MFPTIVKNRNGTQQRGLKLKTIYTDNTNIILKAMSISSTTGISE